MSVDDVREAFLDAAGTFDRLLDSPELASAWNKPAASVALEPPTPTPAAAEVALDVLLRTARSAHGDLAAIRALARKERAEPDVFPVF